MTAESFLAWLFGSVIAQDSFTRLLNSLRGNRAEFRRFAKNVHQRSGIKPGRAYKKWFQTDPTWTQLTAGGKDTHALLVARLSVELAKTPRAFWQKPRDTATDAERLVDASLDVLIESLDPSRSISIVGNRLESRLDLLNISLSVQRSDLDAVRKFPPPCRDILRQIHQGDAHLAARLIEVLQIGPSPSEAVRNILNRRPAWLETAPFAAWQLLGEFATSHGDRATASRVFERLAIQGYNPVASLIRAASLAHEIPDAERADRLFQQAKQSHPEDPLVQTYIAARDGDWPTVARHIDEIPGSTHELQLIGVYAAYHTGGEERGVRRLRRLITENPEIAGFRIVLAQLLRDKLIRDPSSLSEADRDEIMTMITKARDLRREWDGPSADAVNLACEIATIQGKWSIVLNIGRTTPSGSATPREASDHRVVQWVARAAVAAGQHDVVRQVLPLISDATERAMIQAEQAHSEGNVRRAIDLYMQAWTDASGAAEEQWPILYGLASLGAELPNRDELLASEDFLAAVVLATHEWKSDRLDDAITRLLPWRNRSSHAPRLLADLYVAKGDSAAATDILRRAANHFNDPRLVARAAIIQADSGDLDSAVDLAEEALPITEDTELRARLHEILFAQAWRHHRWQQAEQRIRRAILDVGPTVNARWSLIAALLHQGKHAVAWNEVQEEPELRVETPQHALMWADLNTRYRSDSNLAVEMLELLERFADNPDIMGRLIGLFVFWTARTEVSITDDLVARWRSKITNFIDESPTNPAFRSIKIPEYDDLDGFIEVLREQLEPRAIKYAELCQEVVRGETPYGMLAAFAGRPYSLAIMSKAAGGIFLSSPDLALLEREIADANAAIGGAIVTDASFIVVAALLESLTDRATSIFRSIEISSSAYRDIVRCKEHFEIPSSGTMGWDVAAGMPRFVEESADHRERALSWASRMLEFSGNLDVIDWPELRLLPNPKSQDRLDDRLLTWLAAPDHAATARLPLLSDDLHVRALARHLDVPTFGTVALLQAMVDRGLISRKEHNSFMDKLRTEHCVDLPVDSLALGRAASRENFEARGTAFATSRPAFWRDRRMALEAWRFLVAQAAREAPAHLPGWLFNGVVGATSEATGMAAKATAAAMLVSILRETDFDEQALPDLLIATRWALQKGGVGDPLRSVASLLIEGADGVLSPREIATWLLKLSSKLPDEDRAIVREIAFGRWPAES